MNLRQLRTLVEVARLGSFAAAARRLDAEPSQVTRAVAAVEAELGARLLHRTSRRVTLTEAGAGYLERIGPLLTQLEAAADELHSATGELRGTVRLTAAVSYGQLVVMPLLARLHERHPALQLDLQFSDAVVDLLGDQVDLALRMGPQQDGSLVGLPLAPVHYRVCASPAYLARHGRPRVPADLAACDCLRFSLPGFRDEWLFRPRGVADAAVEAVAISGWMTATSALALHRAALDGLGPALLANWIVDADLAAGRLVDLMPGHEATATAFDSAVWLLYPSRAHLPRRVRVVADFLKDELGS